MEVLFATSNDDDNGYKVEVDWTQFFENMEENQRLSILPRK